MKNCRFISIDHQPVKIIDQFITQFKKFNIECNRDSICPLKWIQRWRENF